MRSELPAAEGPLPPEDQDRRIIPFPRLMDVDRCVVDGWDPSPPRARHAVGERHIRAPRGEALARHYLKVMLPAIPITMFVVGFVYCSLLVDPRTPVPSNSPAAREAAQSALPLIGALLLALTSGLLCVMIYCGCQRASSERAAREA
jgi:hypothetical protein